MKYKNLTKEQIIISLDRLTRFKPTKEKYIRVFRDIMTTALTEPQIKKTSFGEFEPQSISDIVSEILNSSIQFNLGKEAYEPTDLSINNILKQYENNIFNNDVYTQIFLENRIDYKNAVKLIQGNSPINLKWLNSLSNLSYDRLINNREINALKYPIEKVLIVEGLTEETLLPSFSKFIGFDFDKYGIQLIPAGGKNQVVRLYYELCEQLKLPIFLLLDKDAQNNLNQIKPKLRDIDKIHLVSCGEFEDLLPKSLIIKTVNKHLHNFASITENDLKNDLSEVENLEQIFKLKGLHDFKKAEFAKLVKENISEKSDVSFEIQQIIEEILQ